MQSLKKRALKSFLLKKPRLKLDLGFLQEAGFE